MNLFRRLFGNKQTQELSASGFIKGPGTFAVDVVGESRYQDNLERICGKRSKEGEEKPVTASLICEDNNPKDNQAVKVDINGLTVGYLSREEAREYRKELKKLKHGSTILNCQALIVGGWKRGSDVGHYGVKLDLPNG